MPMGTYNCGQTTGCRVLRIPGVSVGKSTTAANKELRPIKIKV